MRNNVFIKSVMRQPARTVLLAVLIVVAAFAFVARVTEFLVVNDEIDRIEGLYRSIGVLSPIRPTDITTSHDVSAAAEFVAQSPYVAASDERVFVQGVLSEGVSLASQFPMTDFLNPSFEGIDMDAMDYYFIGMVRIGWVSPRLVRGSINYINLTIEPRELLIGDPVKLRTEDTYFVNALGQRAPIMSRRDMWLILTDEEADLFEAGLFNPLAGIEDSRELMFRASPLRVIPFNFIPTTQWIIRPLCGSPDGIRNENLPIGWSMPILDPYAERASALDMLWTSNPHDIEAHAATMAQIQPQFDIAAENMSSLMMVGTTDMSAIPRFQNPFTGRLVDGRWLTYEDNLSGNAVAVVPAGMAARGGLGVGETFTVTLMDNSRPNWIDQENDNTWWSVGIEGWWQAAPQGWWVLNEGLAGAERASHEITVEVVGVYANLPPVGGRQHNFLNSEVFIPASLIPAGFGWENAPLLSTMYSFVLNSPRYEQAFMDANRAQLQHMGFLPRFLPSGYHAFAAAVDPIRTSLTVNLIIFSIVSLLILALVITLYLRQWRRCVAISRALGTPAGLTLRQLFSPVFLIWTPAILLGSVIAWFFAINQAQGTLGGLTDEVVSRNPVEMFAFAGIMALIAFGGLVIAGTLLARKPVLEQLQGASGAGAPKRGIKVKAVDPGIVPEGFKMGQINIPPKPATSSKGAQRAAVFKHIRRHIFRSPVKSALVAVVAAFFVVSLGWLNNTIETTEVEINRLWDTTVVEAEIIRDLEDERALMGFAYNHGHAPVTQAVVDSFMASGFVGEIYLEALWMFGFLRSEAHLGDIVITEQFFNETDLVLGVSHLDGFINENTRTAMDDALGIIGESIEITYAPGFSAADFAFGEGVTPIIVRAALLAELGYSLGDILYLSEPFAQVQVIASFEYGLSRAVNIFGIERGMVIMPLDALEFHTIDSPFFENPEYNDAGWDLGGLTYKTVRIDMNTARNRELEELSPLVEGALTMNHIGAFIGTVPLELVMNDQELRDIIEPMEQNLSLMRVLYPIAIGVAAVLSIGLSLLIMLQNAKNAAIMRILGKPKTNSQIALCGEQVLTSIFGVVLGLVALLAIGVAAFEAAPIALTVMYFVGVVVGSAVGAVLISAKTPLELLQVRE
ncbi:MAG: hypothetical protein LBE35_00750 [Clostridiales bacterium]|jgi:hypothetical protein|nr:hypothetical protein [Clostridiales bacterium]